MDWENLYSLQRHRKIPVGSVIQHDDPFFLNRKQVKKETLIEKPMFLSRVNTISIDTVYYVCVCIAVLLSSKDGL